MRTMCIPVALHVALWHCGTSRASCLNPVALGNKQCHGGATVSATGRANVLTLY